MKEKYDCIVVGAGPGGTAAAYTLASNGLNVIQLERGEYPGSKNVQGAVLYANSLEKIIPEFRMDAPLERFLAEQRVWIIDKDAYVGTTHRTAALNWDNADRYTILRAPFDRWFSKKAQEAGVLLICETTVLDLIKEKERVIGVRTDREDGELYGEVVILADGVNSMLARKAGFRKEIVPKEVALGVKETIFIPQEILENRFGLVDNQGVAIEMLGSITRGMLGTAFLYTNKESISIGIGCLLADLKKEKIPPFELLESLKNHPAVKPLIVGGEAKEYSAHLIPEGGYHAMPQIYGEGWMVVGDAAMFVNSIHREGSNLAMESGRLAAETVIEIKKKKGRFNKENLALYKEKLEKSFVLKDLRKYKNFHALIGKNRHFLTTYPEIMNDSLFSLLKVDGVDKRTKEKETIKNILKKRSVSGILQDAIQLWRATR
ncbi:FAD-dependent oxidoreductase [Candidatus Methylacidiphilum fumarolicum]|uniref:Protein fixC n=2 Tax=Candidatus Methylacidiphilum fumarolicum TaxID=591154 RepID=I0JYP6_METFB|nr:FAD-dependent oxidoreductase [Candidatus Methylacidiphilum fumarolicum]MBW6415081.1 FAD-dependent monooxygenase [Candidatus Methylacidiphilum fumarolicum]TFE69688.1 nitrogen fixation protein FixC [Candidatus Methylacidiphilum fumarolicum]TFE74843.1 FAD-dependent oxidoreductase [Candidatus Methylacidiphilum fumarolicum]TFE75488.1 FAD-dependent oxidoreductase [Candidatus Methylacidiphilum fumarolicum]TFE78002.1 nitrogen fixation protein FixC [Candidatus Methylacidiphilum fumarolicum]